MISYNDITEKKHLNFKDVDLKKAAIYSGEDVYITNLIYNKHKEEKTTENKVLTDIDIPLIEVIKDMEID
jgi:DNA polymerase I-like protein with 3'-5' exonuclease and polymerase domains